MDASCTFAKKFHSTKPGPELDLLRLMKLMHFTKVSNRAELLRQGSSIFGIPQPFYTMANSMGRGVKKIKVY